MRVTLSNGMSYKAEKDGSVTVTDTNKIKFDHDKIEFDKWFDKLVTKNGMSESVEAQCAEYDEEQLDLYY
tara:strand:- start:345 stop:554 length:210 start_codon:yes stop_codon:yes gene_type:complete